MLVVTAQCSCDVLHPGSSVSEIVTGSRKTENHDLLKQVGRHNGSSRCCFGLWLLSCSPEVKGHVLMRNLMWKHGTIRKTGRFCFVCACLNVPGGQTLIEASLHQIWNVVQTRPPIMVTTEKNITGTVLQKQPKHGSTVNNAQHSQNAPGQSGSRANETYITVFEEGGPAVNKAVNVFTPCVVLLYCTLWLFGDLMDNMFICVDELSYKCLTCYSVDSEGEQEGKQEVYPSILPTCVGSSSILNANPCLSPWQRLAWAGRASLTPDPHLQHKRKHVEIQRWRDSVQLSFRRCEAANCCS